MSDYTRGDDPVYNGFREGWKRPCDAKEEIDQLWDIVGGISLDRLRELVEADADGRCVVLPCKVGDDVYRLFTDGAGNIDDEEVYEDKIHEFYFDENGLGISIDAYDGHIGNYTHEGCDTGVWRIFLTRAEAEAALGKEESKG
jgi:hypothetical protein